MFLFIGTVLKTLCLYLLVTCVQGQDLCPDVEECYCFNSWEDCRADCRDTDLTVIPTGLPVNLTQIHITLSDIHILLSGNLSLYKSLTQIELFDNAMREIEPGAFDGVELLENLYLQSNRLSTLDSSIFTTLTELISLYLNGNKLTNVPNLKGLSKLEYLNLNTNNITVISSTAFEDNVKLLFLDIISNQIETIEANAFQNLNALKYLLLDGNSLVTLQQGAFNGLTELTTLSLMHNKLEELVDDTFSGAGQNLFELYLSNNKITTIQENAFSGLSKLELLHLEYNNLANVPSDAIKKIENLHFIDLSANLIQTLEDNSFSGLGKLDTINIGNMNSLTEVKVNAFSGTVNLTQLSLYGNKNLKTFTAEHLPDSEHEPLVILRLYNNGFESLEEEIFSTKASLEKVDLYDNPFHCDCALEWMPRVVLDDVIWARHWDDEIPVLCETPDHLQTFEIPLMRSKDFTCVEPKIEVDVPDAKVVAYLHENATLKAYGHNGIPRTCWVAPSGESYIPIRSVPSQEENTQRISAIEVFNKTELENVVVATLEFENTTLEDAGFYTVWASNHIANTSTEIELEVLPYEPTTVYPTTTNLAGEA